MYVRGQGQDDFGTVLPAEIDYQYKNNQVLKADVVGTNSKSSFRAKQKFNVIGAQFHPEKSSIVS